MSLYYWTRGRVGLDWLLDEYVILKNNIGDYCNIKKIITLQMFLHFLLRWNHCLISLWCDCSFWNSKLWDARRKRLIVAVVANFPNVELPMGQTEKSHDNWISITRNGLSSRREWNDGMALDVRVWGVNCSWIRVANRMRRGNGNLLLSTLKISFVNASTDTGQMKEDLLQIKSI